MVRISAFYRRIGNRNEPHRKCTGHRDPSAISSYTSVLLPSQTLYSSANGNIPTPKSGIGPLPPMNLVPKSLPTELKFHVPPEFKKEFSDWSVIFNPDVPRVLDVNLVHTLAHERFVILMASVKRPFNYFYQRCMLCTIFARWQIFGNWMQPLNPNIRHQNRRQNMVWDLPRSKVTGLIF